MRRFVDFLLFPICVALLAYFGWVYFYGSRSIGVAEAAEARAAGLEQALQQLRAEREAQDRRVGLLRSDSLDTDMLEERARSLLLVVKPSEYVILNKDLN